jgi:hypothetical protein
MLLRVASSKQLGRKQRLLSFATLLVSAAIALGQSETITFEDAFQADSYQDYHGLSWNNFIFTSTASYPPSGAVNGTVSGTNVTFNGFGNPASFGSTNAFDLNSAYLTADWRDGLQVEVQGYRGQALAFDNTWILNTTSPTLINFNYLDVNQVTIITSGGVNAGYGADGTQVVMDNLTVTFVPEPSPVALGALGALGLAFWKLRKRQA